METSSVFSVKSYDIADCSREEEPGKFCPCRYSLLALLVMSLIGSLYTYYKGG